MLGMSTTNHIIRVHTAEGRVYARILEPWTPPWQEDPVYSVIGPVAVPVGLDQQRAVEFFRDKGWEVQQDNGTDFDNPEWGE